MKKLTVVSLLFLLLVACQNQENTEDAQQSSTSQEKEDIPPEYLDETNYTGDKLEIVKLMNARMRYLYEEDEKRYMNLFDPKSPISSMGRYKVLKVTPMSDITIQEQRKLFQAVVTVNELKENNEEYNNTMVFWKKKEDGDKAQWVIADID
ncbi:hypothetical protein MKY66_08175 [Paenibacillus sp. FSL R5-0766]|uniref:hypothetical protein n=1 Tax=unclassified Paenibacillus TaxID=185978 RepID=UPI00096E04AE|nr:hypothetical protein [Paenibacillus sp. FSL R5-0765]OMF67918.1 hypothetical protein BK141_03725 [Paenibacillus sp. FSL R5-0765]